MAKRKRVKRHSKKISRKKVPNLRFLDTKKKFKIVFQQLLLFIALALVSLVLYRFIDNEFLASLFFVMTLVFSFVAVGFLIVLLILVVIKFISKKR